VTAFNGYPISVFLAVLLHGVVLGTLLLFQQAESEVLDVIRPPSVKALLVSENPQARNERQQQQSLQQQREREQQERAQQQREQQQREQREREQQEQARQEQLQQEQARQTQLRQERERQEQQRREEEARRLEQERREQERLEQERLEQQRQQEAERQRQQEEQAQAAAAAAGEAAETEAEITMAYTAVIHDLVQRNWSRPPSARNDMTAVVRIRLVPTGDVVDVEIVRSSGDAAFDRAAENAVRAVGRFTELQGMPPRMFERNFRSLLLTFRPEDLLN
jgi:colicin import membrane protein